MRLLPELCWAAVLVLCAVHALPISESDIRVAGTVGKVERAKAKKTVKTFCDAYAPDAVRACVQPIRVDAVTAHFGPDVVHSWGFERTRPRWSVTMRDAQGKAVDHLRHPTGFDKPRGAPHVVDAHGRPVPFAPLQPHAEAGRSAANVNAHAHANAHANAHASASASASVPLSASASRHRSQIDSSGGAVAVAGGSSGHGHGQGHASHNTQHGQPAHAHAPHDGGTTSTSTSTGNSHITELANHHFDAADPFNMGLGWPR